jgi:hypothetical protein
LINQDDKTDQKIGGVDSEDAGESTLSSNIEEYYLDHQQEVLHLGQARRDKSSGTTEVALAKELCRADAVRARPPLPNSRNIPAAITPPLLKCQKSSFLNNLSASDHAPSTQALVIPNKSSGDQNSPQPKASRDQNVPKHEKATFEVAKRIMEAIVLTKTRWPILSDIKHSLVEEAWRLAIAAQDHQGGLAGAPVGTPSVCQLPGGPSLKIDPQTRDAVSHEFCSIHLYQTDGY